MVQNTHSIVLPSLPSFRAVQFAGFVQTYSLRFSLSLLLSALLDGVAVRNKLCWQPEATIGGTSFVSILKYSNIFHGIQI